MIANALQVCVALILGVAAAGKVVAPGDLANAIRASRTFPKNLAAPLARLVIGLEIALALAVLSLQGRPLVWAFTGVGLLAVAFVVWSGSVRARGIKLRCGCFGGASKNVSWWTVARAATLGGLALAGALVASSASSFLGDGALALVSSMGLLACVLLITAFLRTRAALVLTGSSMQSLRSLSGEVRT